MSGRRSLVVAGAVVGSTLLAGCSYTSPQTTATPYAASDGVQADLGSTGVRNLMLISGGKNKPGRLYGSLVNSGTSAVQVNFNSPMGTLPAVSVPAGGVVNLKSKSLRLAKVTSLPGQTVTMTVSAGNQSTQLNVPILDGTLPEYRTLVPSATASTAGASTSAKSGATKSAKPGAKATAGSTARATPSSTAR